MEIYRDGQKKNVFLRNKFFKKLFRVLIFKERWGVCVCVCVVSQG